MMLKEIMLIVIVITCMYGLIGLGLFTGVLQNKCMEIKNGKNTINNLNYFSFLKNKFFYI